MPSARRRALLYLARREYGARELVDKLRAKGVANDDAEAVVGCLVSDGLVSDERFADSLIRSRVERGYGPRRIRVELRRRGVAAETVNEVLRELVVDWTDCARRARRRHFGSALPESAADRRRQAQYLLRRGFDSDDVSVVLRDS